MRHSFKEGRAMKKLILSLAALVMMASGLHAAGANTFYGTGNTGQLFTDQCCGHDAAAVGTVLQPSSPTPAEGDQWFAYADAIGTGCGNYVSMSALALPDGSEGSIYFWMQLTDTSIINSDALIYTGSTVAGTGGHYFIVRFGSGNFVVQESGGGFSQVSASGFGDLDKHLIRIRWGSFGCEVYKDAALVGSDGTAAATLVLTQAYLLDSPGFGFGTCAEAVLIDAIQLSTNPDATYLGPGVPTATPTWTPTGTPSSTPTWTRTWSPTATPTATPTWTVTPSFSNSPTSTATPSATRTHTRTHTPTASPTRTRTPTASPTISNTFSVTRTLTSTRTSTPSVTATPTAAPGTLSFNYSVANQVYCTWPGTNINPGGGATVYVAYGPKSGSTYPYLANGGYDPVNHVFFATVPRGAPFYARGRVINQQGTFSTAEGFAYGIYTLTPTPTRSPTRTNTPVVTQTPSVTRTKTPTPTATAVFTEVAVDTSVPGQTYITWESNATVQGGMDVFVQYGTTTAYGFQAGGGYDADTSTYFCTVPRDATTDPFHFRCVIINTYGTKRSADFSAP